MLYENILFLLLIYLSYYIHILGQNIRSSAGTTKIFQKGENATIDWLFPAEMDKNSYRTWYFTSSDGKLKNILLGDISDNETPKIKTKKLDIEIVKPATLILKNVNSAYNGTYVFSIPPSLRETISVFIEGIVFYYVLYEKKQFHCIDFF